MLPPSQFGPATPAKASKSAAAMGQWDSFAADEPTYSRLWRGFMTARVVIALALLLASVAYSAVGMNLRWDLPLLLAYFGWTAWTRLVSADGDDFKPNASTTGIDVSWVRTVGVDVVVYGLLHWSQFGGLNLGALLALPVLMAALLGSGLLAQATAAAATLILLTDAWVPGPGAVSELAGRTVQAGVYGICFFGVAWLAGQMAQRLVREQLAARRSTLAAKVQAQINNLVIDDLGDGVLVVDENMVVRSLNPAGRRLLGGYEPTRAAPFVLAADASWYELVELARDCLARQQDLEGTAGITHRGMGDRRLKVRTRLVRDNERVMATLCVMFLEDLRELEARVRTEKLAAMGRMSAAVAHEIRNPLAAISQANALLAESLTDESMGVSRARLVEIVHDNARRLGRIVDDVLGVARPVHGSPTSDLIDLSEVAPRLANEWARQTRNDARLQLPKTTTRVAVQFDEEPLRQVLVNLLDNAARYASKTPGAIRVSITPTQTYAELRVTSDGKPIPRDAVQHLFEPFFSSESRSSGLGLYICRELCERYGAKIIYEYLSDEAVHGNSFVVRLRLEDGSTLDESGFGHSNLT
jgi:two-component system, NtrC family, sensor histidine kinase PilS